MDLNGSKWHWLWYMFHHFPNQLLSTDFAMFRVALLVDWTFHQPSGGELSLRAEVNSKPPIAHAMDMGKRGFVSQTQTHECSLVDFKEAMECPSPITAIPSVPGTKLALALSRSPDTLENCQSCRPAQTDEMPFWSILLTSMVNCFIGIHWLHIMATCKETECPKPREKADPCPSWAKAAGIGHQCGCYCAAVPSSDILQRWLEQYQMWVVYLSFCCRCCFKSIENYHWVYSF